MGQAKQIQVRPISKQDADRVVRMYHYSGKVDPRSQLHFGVFLGSKCHGAIQFGPSIDKGKTIRLVRNTHWNGFIELNRMAFSDALPRLSESRALGVAFRIMRREYPHLKWCVSFSDATQSGDGSIYRATGFVLTQIKENKSMWRMPDDEVVCQLSFTIGGSTALRRRYGMLPTETFGMFSKRVGAVCLPGYQLRYVKFLDESMRENLTCDEIPFDRISRMGISMHRGILRAGSKDNVASPVQGEEGGATPTPALQSLALTSQRQE